MTYYHVSKEKEFDFSLFKKSRYGFTALFFTDNSELKDLYLKENKGAEISIDNPFIDYEIDFNNKISYSSVFRNTIINLNKKGYKTVLIKNVIDYPSSANKKFISSDILVVFDLKYLKTLL
ncbi:nitrous oxidase accessory protein NosD [Mesoflavibacter sabulilitoris]|uniref:Uncharacterized protein n=1 Tax=Mesoflavibacter zeaxanthinifaciens subsp. sabulilitoris TaxID=1520893 RepID=A0A2T1NAH0_9FLAO|nr:hypothetical protein [Mesoflavibacter zeaxanthinifaciens]MBB3123735.1 nitrous oxidase accessory protein NosD [Mesoflavibacter zeaxanthinifaciens subsp. sabulilitoris]PSG89144.1 hypothetical protein C7H61_09305 [Mesoflavibacter zeaxanthinifaciens subsp. sabulilitoris]